MRIMKKTDRVTELQAKTLKELGYDSLCTMCMMDKGFFRSHPVNWNNKHLKGTECFVSLPTVDEVIDWLRSKHNIIVYNYSAPFVDSTNKITYGFAVKRCNLRDGWNGRLWLGGAYWSHNIYASKRKAISIALSYLKKKKNGTKNKKRDKNDSSKKGSSM